MSSIVDIPTELLDHILKLVDNPITQMSICRKFNNVASPIAYRRIQLTGGRVISLFLRTVINRPALGLHTRFLCFQSGCWLLEQYIVAQPYLFDFSAEATTRGLPHEVQVGLKKGSIEAMFLLLLSYLPVIQTLHIDALEDVDDIFARHISSATTLHSGLQSLRLLIINRVTAVDGDYIIPLLRLPALRTLSCQGTNPDCTVSDKELPPGSSSIEHILLEYSGWKDGPLATLIGSSRSLRHLTYRSNMPGVLGSFYMSSTWDALLGNAKHTLESLDLLFPDENPIGPVGSPGLLRDFLSLTRLCVTLTLLIGPSREDNPIPLNTVLPESLVLLVVWIDDDWWGMGGQLLTDLLATRSMHDRFGDLEELHIGGGIEGSELEAVQSVCLAEGVKFGTFETAFSITVVELETIFSNAFCHHETLV